MAVLRSGDERVRAMVELMGTIIGVEWKVGRRKAVAGEEKTGSVACGGASRYCSLTEDLWGVVVCRSCWRTPR